MHSRSPSTWRATNGYMARNTSVMVTPGRGSPLHVEQRRSERRRHERGLQIDRYQRAEPCHQGGVVPMWSEKSYFARIGPKIGSTIRQISIHSNGKPSRKISTMTKVSISHFVLTPICARVDTKT